MLYMRARQKACSAQAVPRLFFLLRNSSSEPVLSVVRPAPARASSKRACSSFALRRCQLGLRPLAVILLLSLLLSWRRSFIVCRLTVDFFAGERGGALLLCLIQPAGKALRVPSGIYAPQFLQYPTAASDVCKCFILYIIPLNSCGISTVMRRTCACLISTISGRDHIHLLVAVTGLK